MRTPRLPAVDWTDAPADLNGLVRFAERRNLVSARVPAYFKRSVLIIDLDSRWRWSVSLTAQLFHPGQRATVVHKLRGWVGLMINLGGSEKQENFLLVPRNRTMISHLSISQLVTIPTIISLPLSKSICLKVKLTLNLPTTTIVAQPFNVIKWQLKFNPVT